MFCSNLFTATKSKIFLLIAVSIILIIRLVSDAWTHSEDWHDHGVEGLNHDVNGFADSDHSKEKFGVETDEERFKPAPMTEPHYHKWSYNNDDDPETPYSDPTPNQPYPKISHRLGEDPRDEDGNLIDHGNHPEHHGAHTHGHETTERVGSHTWIKVWIPPDHGEHIKTYKLHSHKLKPGHPHDPPPPSPNKPPVFGDGIISSVSATVGKSLSGVVLPAATDPDGDDTKITYSVRSLPKDIGFNPDTRELSGTPTMAGTTTFTYIASDELGAMTTLTFEFEIVISAAAEPPLKATNKLPIFNKTISDVSGTVGMSISQVVLPAATDPDGDDSKIVYVVQGLPSGFGFNSDTRVLVGIPTVVGTSTCTYTATDEKGAIARLSFEVDISEPIEAPDPPAPPEPIEPPDPPAPPEPIEPPDPPAPPEQIEPHQGSVDHWTQTVSEKQIGFSELMFASEGGVNSDPHPQWIELYNNSTTDTVNLSGFILTIEARDKSGQHRYARIPLGYIEIRPNSAVIIAAWYSYDTKNVSENDVYNFFDHHFYSEFDTYTYRNMILGLSGFYLKLENHNGMIVDEVGNIDGKQGEDSATWQLPEDILSTRRRTSLVRRYNVSSDTPEDGKLKKNWKPTSLFTEKADMHYGIRTDVSTPAYRNKDKALPVELSHFGAKSVDGNVVVTWATQSELNNAGFNILRSENPNADFRIINPALIAGQGTTSDKTEYSYKDTAANRNTQYYYRIQEVSIDGEIQVVDQVNMKGYISPSNKLVSKWATIKQR